MNKQKQKGKTKTQFGLFLFFVVGLFALQIAFAFTLHGDIGPQTDAVPSIEKPVSPVLVGRIDSLVSNAQKTIVSNKVAPEGAFAPASKKMTSKVMSFARIDTEPDPEAGETVVRKTEKSRFYSYIIRRGDTLQKISRKLYGSRDMVQSLVRLNRIKNEKALQLGSSLYIPRAGLLKTIKVL
ncbi:MAG: LysM peptidoglycan-binding domain-containing protein [Candidatus Rifleibacteriota bacterium]